MTAHCLFAGEDPQSLEAFPGRTPVLDGIVSPGEWDDATEFDVTDDVLYGIDRAGYRPTTQKPTN